MNDILSKKIKAISELSEPVSVLNYKNVKKKFDAISFLIYGIEFKDMPAKKVFSLYIKSHDESLTDYEDRCEAETKGEAVDIFLERIQHFVEVSPSWDKESLMEFVSVDN